MFVIKFYKDINKEKQKCKKKKERQGSTLKQLKQIFGPGLILECQVGQGIWGDEEKVQK